ncbi:hypothetical protein FRC08_009564 [Ceratobasidium sp. 394]|nr:hypothetical protein FRC08_009564 [Ceratobasidium sp. 394]
MSKRGHCTVEGAGSSKVIIQIEHIDENTPSSKKSKPRKDVNKRRKAAPKTMEFQVNGLPKSHAEHDFLQNETPEPRCDEVEDTNDPFGNWLQDFDEVAHTNQPPAEKTAGTNKASQRKTPNHVLREWKALHCDSYVQVMYELISIVVFFAWDSIGSATLAYYLRIAFSRLTAPKSGMELAGWMPH